MFTLIVEKDVLDEIFVSYSSTQLSGFIKFLHDVRSMRLIIDVPMEDGENYSQENPLYEALTESITDYQFQPSISIEVLSTYFTQFVFGIVNSDLELFLRKKGYPAISGESFHSWKVYDTLSERKSWEVSDEDSDRTITDWTKLKGIRHAWNSLLIIDHYLLSDQWQMQEKGWAGLISQVLENDSEKCEITIVPLRSAVKDPLGRKKHLTPADRDSAIESVKQKFSSLIAHHTSSGKKVKSCIALMNDNRKLEEFRIHDRYMITNGFFVEPRSSFNLFGKSTLTETTISCEFVFFSDVAHKVEKRLKRWSSYIDDLKHNPEIGTVAGSKNWFGDKYIGFFRQEKLDNLK